MVVHLIYLLILVLPLMSFNDNAGDKMIYDYCNVNDSRTVYHIIKDIVSYFKINKENLYLSSSKCFIIDDMFLSYLNKFHLLESVNLSASIIVKCPYCQKKFRSRPFLHLHYRLSHLSSDERYDREYFCPGDFCKGINCDRYKIFYSIPYIDANGKDILTYNRQPISKTQVCNPELIPFYKNLCMKLIEGCFAEEEEGKYYLYYKNICQKITCEYGINNQLNQSGEVWGVLRMIFMYITGISAFIYLLVVWLTKYA